MSILFLMVINRREQLSIQSWIPAALIAPRLEKHFMLRVGKLVIV